MRKVWPMGSWPGQYFLAVVSLTMATSRPCASSEGANARPRTKSMPITLEIFGRDHVVARAERGGIGGRGAAIDDQRIAAVAQVAQRHGAGVAYRFNAGDLMQARVDAVGEVAGLRSGHPDLVGIGGEVEHVIRLEAKVHGLHGGEAAHEESCDHQQNERAGDLQGDQAVAEPVAAARDAAAAFVKDGIHVGPGHLHRRARPQR